MPLLLIVTLLCSVPVAYAQPAAGDGDWRLLDGRVVAAADGAPLAGVRVTVLVASGAVASDYSTRDGTFSVRVPERGGWRLSLTRAGFAPALRDVAHATGERLVVGLQPGAVITGRVLDERGDPLPGAAVRIRRVCPTACETDIATPVTFSVDTDDRGVYRLGSLPAGGYTVELAGSAMASRMDAAVALVAPDAGGGSGFSRSAPPAGGATDAGARGTMVEVGAGTEAVVHLARVEPSRLPPSQTLAGPSVRAAGSIIRGRILADSGRPVAGVAVQATSLDGTARMGRTDVEGRYEIFGLAAGSYRVTVPIDSTRPDRVALGQRRARQQGTVLVLGSSEVLDGVDVRLPPLGVVTGRVVGAYGEPLEGLTVQVWERQVTAGGVRLSAAVRGLTAARTDDRGHYRMQGLLPGIYYVSVTDAGGTALDPRLLATLDRSIAPVEHTVVSVAGLLPARSSARIFHPAAITTAAAATVRLEPGQDAHGIDITFDPMPAARVAGVALDSTGRPARGTVRLAMSHRSGGPVPPALTVPTDAGGAFAFVDVPPGEYVVHVVTDADGPTPAELLAGPLPTEQAFAIMAAATNEFGMEYVTVTGTDDVVVRVRTSPRALVRARVVAEGDRSGIDAFGFDIALESADLDRVTEPVFFRRLGEEPWTFERQNVTGPMRFQLRRAPPGWYLTSAFVGGVDAAEYPYMFTGGGETVHAELVVARGGDIGGRVIDARDRPVADYFVVAFTIDPTRWYVGSRHAVLARAGHDGRFTIDGLPAGEYWVVAVDDVSGDDTSLEWQSSEALNRLTAGARRVRVAEGQHVPLELRLLRLSP